MFKMWLFTTHEPAFTKSQLLLPSGGKASQLTAFCSLASTGALLEMSQVRIQTCQFPAAFSHCDLHLELPFTESCFLENDKNGNEYLWWLERVLKHAARGRWRTPWCSLFAEGWRASGEEEETSLSIAATLFKSIVQSTEHKCIPVQC